MCYIMEIGYNRISNVLSNGIWTCKIFLIYILTPHIPKIESGFYNKKLIKIHCITLVNIIITIQTLHKITIKVNITYETLKPEYGISSNLLAEVIKYSQNYHIL